MKKIILTFFALICSISCLGQIIIDGFNYNLSIHYINKQNNDGTITRIKIVDAILVSAPKTLSGSFTIPTAITHKGKRYEVIYIGPQAFKDCNLLNSINLSKIAHVDFMAFENCTALTKVIFPEGIKSIGNNAFSGCTSLTDISFPEKTRMTSIGIGAFMNCTNLGFAELPYVHNNYGGFEELSSNLFNGCSNLIYVKIPSTIEGIGSHAFEGCKNLTDIYCYSTKAPKLPNPKGTNIFKGTNIDGIRIHVPQNALKNYENTAWNQFKSIDTNMTRPQVPNNRKKEDANIKPLADAKKSNYNNEIDAWEDVEVMPSFRQGLDDFVKRNMKYPVVAEENGIQGDVTVTFIVEPDGDITNVEAKGPHKTLESEAKRIIKLSAYYGWNPGKHNNEAVRVRMKKIVHFRL
jgi:TonB family protein